MAVDFNHTIISVLNRKASAKFLSEILGLPAPVTWGPFDIVTTANGVSLDFMEKKGDIPSRHFAFLVSETEFDQIFSRIQERSLRFWADPACKQTGEINTHDGGRGVYFHDPNGHLLEIITRPYGSSGSTPRRAIRHQLLYRVRAGLLQAERGPLRVSRPVLCRAWLRDNRRMP